MERYLVIALDENCNIYKTLMKAESNELDKFTSKFEDTYDIRKHFEKQIEEFFNDNADTIKNMEEKNNRKETGDIVVNEVNEYGMPERKRVIYKKSIIVFKEIIKKRSFMQVMARYDHYGKAKNNFSIFSGFENYIIMNDFTYKQGTFLANVSKWKTRIKKSENYYNIIRVFLKKYNEKYNELGLKSMDAIYKEYKINTELKNKEKQIYEEEVEDEIIEDDYLIYMENLYNTVSKQDDDVDLDRQFIPDIDDAYKYVRESDDEKTKKLTLNS